VKTPGKPADKHNLRPGPAPSDVPGRCPTAFWRRRGADSLTQVHGPAEVRDHGGEEDRRTRLARVGRGGPADPSPSGTCTTRTGTSLNRCPGRAKVGRPTCHARFTSRRDHRQSLRFTIRGNGKWRAPLPPVYHPGHTARQRYEHRTGNDERPREFRDPRHHPEHTRNSPAATVDRVLPTAHAVVISMNSAARPDDRQPLSRPPAAVENRLPALNPHLPPAGGINLSAARNAPTPLTPDPPQIRTWSPSNACH
jgi:hypothetical protein